MDWDPFEEMKEFKRKMDKAFEDFFKKPEIKRIGFEKKLPALRKPESDVVIKDGNAIVKIDLPGIDKKDIQLNVTENHVEVKAEKKEETKVEKKGFFKQERSYAGYYRVIPLPEVKAELADANYKNGVLEIKIPLKEKLKKIKKKIEIK